MIKLYCEGKYDSIYINRIIEYYKLSDLIDVEPLGGKTKVYAKYKRNSTDILVIDFDFRLTKEQESKIRSNPSNFILIKRDMEDYFFQSPGRELTRREKKALSYKFRDLSDNELMQIFNNLKNLNIIEVIEYIGTCSNITNFFDKINVNNR